MCCIQPFFHITLLFSCRREVTEKTPLLYNGSSPIKHADRCKRQMAGATAKMGVWYTMKERLKNRVLLVDVLAALFGMGAWLSINGMYTQLPLLVFNAPEGWMLPSFIVVLIQASATLFFMQFSSAVLLKILSVVILLQAANIGGVCYGMVQQFCKGKVPDSIFIFILMFIGCISLLLMSFFYG